MGSHYYTAVKAGTEYTVTCQGCGHVAAFERTEIEAAVAANKLNKSIEESFGREGQSNPANYGLSRRMRLAKRRPRDEG